MNTRKNASFPLARLAAIQQMELNHFWFAGRLRIIGWLLDNHVRSPLPTILDAGCGTGHNLHSWLPYAQQVIGIDQWMSAAPAPSRCDSEDLSISYIEGNIYQMPFLTGSIDLAICLDVLEHVPDHDTVNEIKRVLRPGARVLITVPAMPWLWSLRDEQAGHLRRYTKAGLVNLLESAGFRVIYLNYYQCFLLPLVWAGRLLLPFKKASLASEETPSGFINALLNAINRLEFQLLKGMALPWGSSLIVLAEKP